jgi:hypothetical protein
MSGLYQPKVYRKDGGDTLVVASGGKITVESGGGIIFPNPMGGIDYYVNSGVSASGDGLSWDGAFKTITEAAALVETGDRIFIQGSSFNEAVTIDVAGVALIGVGPTSNQALWTAPDTTAPCLTVAAAADVLVQNIRFRPAAYNAAIELTGASHQFQLIGCRIQGKSNSYYGLKTDGHQANVRIEGCEFYYINTSGYGIAIYGHTYSGAEPAGWIIKDCFFHSCLKYISCRMRQSIITGCFFAGKGLIAAGTMAAITTGIDISGATGGCNLVQGNFLGGDYSTATYVAGTDDNWVGNISDDISEVEVEATGATVAVPAA